MDPVEDKSTWTEGRLQDEIAQLLPKGTLLVSSLEDTTWVLSLVQELGGSLLWEVEHYDKRLALFEVYGRLWLERESPSGAWSPRKSRPSLDAVTRRVLSPEPDPGDLDPTEIASVYEKVTF